MCRDSLINDVYKIELDMFVNVHNVNGKALCQSEIETFRIMRMSHLKTWPNDLLKSFLNDLISAKNLGINLMSEKYARMMESTFPEEYQRLKDSLPIITEEKKEMINKLAKILVDWEFEVRSKYPFLDQRGRPLYSKQDSIEKTSFETYTKGELSVYSVKTLSSYLEYCKDLLYQKINGTKYIYENMVQMYGYASLDEAAKNLA